MKKKIIIIIAIYLLAILLVYLYPKDNSQNLNSTVTTVQEEDSKKPYVSNDNSSWLDAEYEKYVLNKNEPEIQLLLEESKSRYDNGEMISKNEFAGLVYFGYLPEGIEIPIYFNKEDVKFLKDFSGYKYDEKGNFNYEKGILRTQYKERLYDIEWYTTGKIYFSEYLKVEQKRLEDAKEKFLTEDSDTLMFDILTFQIYPEELLEKGYISQDEYMQKMKALGIGDDIE